MKYHIEEHRNSFDLSYRWNPSLKKPVLNPPGKRSALAVRANNREALIFKATARFVMSPIRYKLIDSLQIVSTFRYATDAANKVQAIELYRFINQPVSVFAVSCDVVDKVDIDTMKSTLSLVVRREDDATLSLCFPQNVYETVEKVCYERDQVKFSDHKAKDPAGRDRDLGRVVEQIIVCRPFAIAVYHETFDEILARIDFYQPTKNVKRLEQSLRDSIPKVGATPKWDLLRKNVLPITKAVKVWSQVAKRRQESEPEATRDDPRDEASQQSDVLEENDCNAEIENDKSVDVYHWPVSAAPPVDDVCEESDDESLYDADEPESLARQTFELLLDGRAGGSSEELLSKSCDDDEIIEPAKGSLQELVNEDEPVEKEASEVASLGNIQRPDEERRLLEQAASGELLLLLSRSSVDETREIMELRHREKEPMEESKVPPENIRVHGTQSTCETIGQWVSETGEDHALRRDENELPGDEEPRRQKVRVHCECDKVVGESCESDDESVSTIDYYISLVDGAGGDDAACASTDEHYAKLTEVNEPGSPAHRAFELNRNQEKSKKIKRLAPFGAAVDQDQTLRNDSQSELTPPSDAVARATETEIEPVIESAHHVQVSCVYAKPASSVWEKLEQDIIPTSEGSGDPVAAAAETLEPGKGGVEATDSAQAEDSLHGADLPLKEGELKRSSSLFSFDDEFQNRSVRERVKEWDAGIARSMERAAKRPKPHHHDELSDDDITRSPVLSWPRFKIRPPPPTKGPATGEVVYEQIVSVRNIVSKFLNKRQSVRK